MEPIAAKNPELPADKARMDVFVARQAILNRNKELYAYELLFRSGRDSKGFDGADSSSATRQVIDNTLFSVGLEGILCGKRGFINFDRSLLLSDSVAILPKDTLVIEILESVEPDDEVVAACARLCENGYTVALDDFIYHPKFDALIQKAHFIKVDMTLTSRPEQQRLVEKYGKQGIRMLAEKVETMEDFEWARSIGFDYFQGYFFTKPVIVSGRQIPSSKLACVRLFEEVQREELDFDKIRELVRDDVALSYKLLRFTNSALFAHKSEIRTIEHGLMVLGEDGIRRWVAIAALPGLAKDKPHELIVQSLVRARFSERLAALAGFGSGPSWFLLGLFSLLDALLDRKIEFALQQIKLAQPVEEALLGTAPSEDRMATVYALVRGYESGDWDVVTTLAEKIQMRGSDVGAAYVESARWAAEVSGLAA
jgi:EAL and modified HD-GYP domain-containing signal transduction protein